MENMVGQCLLYIMLLALLAWPLGIYMGKVMDGEPFWLQKVLTPCERGLYRAMGINPAEQMGWKRYLGCVLAFSAVSIVVLMLLLMAQGSLPLNPQGIAGTSWDLALNTAASFVTNTNWQAYSGESAMGYLAQMAGLTVQNFVSAAVGIAVLLAFIRGLRARITETSGGPDTSAMPAVSGLGNFWADATRATLYILVPLSLTLSLLLIWQGVPQNFSPYKTVALLEPLTTEEGATVTEQMVPLGPQASQVAPKQLGTNGGGYNGVNSAHPHENPTPLANMLEMLALLLIPAGLCFTFGRQIKDMRQGVVIFIAMILLLTAAIGFTVWAEQIATPQLAQGGQVDLAASSGLLAQAGGNMEGKEARFGITNSAIWAAATTAASNGSVNAMHDSLTPLGGLVPMVLMQLGEVVFGGVGSGLYGMLAFVLLTVFMAGLMVGRTPEYLGKKVEPFEMKMAVVVCLTTPVVILIGAGLMSIVPQVVESLSNALPHGFSELLYAATSAGANNGSAFAGLNANTPFLNVLLSALMLAGRFVPVAAILAAAASMAGKKTVAASSGTLSTSNGMFVFLLIFVVLLVGALSFFPALALGPVAEHLQMAR
ncbi:potassium-transporting ATPase subunit KdpA [Desulfovibrio desulfuricans]|uniref:potassium-transporting ATPase subunit KdpA n=1 Tax=Desulfovibrio desulfuricans TaxID=876 RepID=UPI001AE5E781|nr:potassium-transporting ATPase subunit KdpA [Desulfovibrio desulfuricans]MDD3683684.1 potassium-transporting ATPase subunit KdpA [Desulfovibrio desulfuricans]QTO40944.1 potassium-transporting ATPase subunit KdpA [Desulfovibrio desulfuricans]